MSQPPDSKQSTVTAAVAVADSQTVNITPSAAAPTPNPTTSTATTPAAPPANTPTTTTTTAPTTTAAASTAVHEYIPPNNFSMICEGVYRSSYPTKKNFSFLRDIVQLRTICYLCPEDYPEVNNTFNANNNIRLLRFQMDGNKEPLQEIPEEKMHSAMEAIVDTRNHPLLIHCNAGKHRTGCVSGCVRKLQGWPLVSIFSEYLHFTGSKPRLADQMFIEMYHPQLSVPTQYAASWLLDASYYDDSSIPPTPTPPTTSNCLPDDDDAANNIKNDNNNEATTATAATATN